MIQEDTAGRVLPRDLVDLRSSLSLDLFVSPGHLRDGTRAQTPRNEGPHDRRPGPYDFTDNLVHVSSLHAKMTIVSSKERWRRMGVTGVDEVSHTFLLKTREVARLDEQVMQFFQLVNSLFLHSAIPLNEWMSIMTFSVMPLMTSVRLIELRPGKAARRERKPTQVRECTQI
jgi:hypothetical protein